MLTKKIIEIIAAQFNISIKDINLDTSFKDDLNADSLDLVELIMALEDEFDLEFEDDDVDNFKTVEDAKDYIKRLLDQDN